MRLHLLPAEDDVIRVKCDGELTQAVLHDNPVAETLGKGCFSRKVLLNLENTTHLDTAGVGCLVMNHVRFGKEGGRLVLHSVPPSAEHLLRLLHLDKVLNLAVDETAARRLVQSAACGVPEHA